MKKCNHHDRPLVSIVKRGRQISQCNHCRDLRKTNQSHVKCTCAIASGKFSALPEINRENTANIRSILAPNPINGCLCEVILTCTCVAGHLQDMQEDGSSISSSPASKCHTPPTSITDTPSPQPPHEEKELMTNNAFTSADQKILPNTTADQIFDSNGNSIDLELLGFLENDLDRYLSPPLPSQQ